MKRGKTCVGCGYWRTLVEGGTKVKACHFFLDTGNLRGCPVEECEHYTPTNEEKKRWDNHEMFRRRKRAKRTNDD